MGGELADQLAGIAEQVAIELYGDPNRKLSSKAELRFGNKGSVSLDIGKGIFFDHSENEGGGVLWAIEKQIGVKGRDAFEWLSEHGFDIGEDRPQQQQRERSRDSNRNYGPDDGRDQPRDDGPPFKVTKTWEYLDVDGTELFQVVRMENGLIGKDGKPEKTYRQRRKDESKKGGWDWSTTGVKLVPYRVSDLIEAVGNGNWVFVVEGEKSADRLLDLGIPATTNARGAGKWTEDLNPFFRNARVCIIADDDPQSKKKDGTLVFHKDGRPAFPGIDHANDVAANLYPIARDVRVLQLTDRKRKEDVVDWLDAGGTIEDLYEIVGKAPRWSPQPFRSRFNAIPWEALDDPGPQHEWTVKNLLTRGETSVCAGASQAGKTFVIIDIGMAVARGIDWMGRRVRQGVVIYQAGEGAKGVKKRLRAYRIRQGLALTDPVPFVLMPAQLNLFRDDDPTNAFIEECKHFAEYYGQPLELIIIDTFAKAMTGANENDGRDVGQVLERCARISHETGAHVALVHHMNAEGSKLRGHTSVVANLDNVLIVSQEEGMHDDDHRPIRQVLVEKQKDGERGAKIRFVLGRVVIGKDEDDEDITSCVVLSPNGNASDSPPPERASITDAEAIFIRALEKAVAESGSRPSISSGLPQSIRVVEWKLFKTAYDSIAFDNEEVENEKPEDREKRLNNRNQQLKRIGERLMRKGLIGRENPWVWLTGKPIKGYRRDAPPKEEAEQQSPKPAAMPADDFDDPAALWGDDFK